MPLQFSQQLVGSSIANRVDLDSSELQHHCKPMKSSLSLPVPHVITQGLHACIKLAIIWLVIFEYWKQLKTNIRMPQNCMHEEWSHSYMLVHFHESVCTVTVCLLEQQWSKA